jgi:hypothetical protein
MSVQQPVTASYFTVKPVGDLFALTLENDLPKFNQTLAFLTDQDAEDLANSILAALKEKRGQ